MIVCLSPVAILTLCWGITLCGAWIGLAHPERFDLVALFLDRQEVDAAHYAPLGGVWIGLAFLTWIVADRAAALALPRPQPFALGVAPDRAARMTLRATLVCVGITLLWIGKTAAGAGGLAAFARLAVEAPDPARALLLGEKLFPGMRLAYAALPGTGALAVALLSTGRLSPPARRAALLAVSLSGAVLLVLPVVMSQRLLTLQFAISCYLAACLVRGRPIAPLRLALGAAGFIAVWVVREALTNPTIDRAVADIALQKALYYCANDLWNAVEPLGREIAHTWGALSFSGLSVLTGTDALVGGLLADRIEALETMKGGGEFSLPTTAFIDFGLLGGTLALTLVAVLFRLAWHRGQERLGPALIYAQIGAALFFSSHGNYVTHQNLLASLALSGIVLYAARLRAPGWHGLSDREPAHV